VKERRVPKASKSEDEESPDNGSKKKESFSDISKEYSKGPQPV
jgi:hypothetical protein